eukprot:COSAG01_NODE_6634_length_3569_cov_1.447550_3_plen_223_part_00
MMKPALSRRKVTVTDLEDKRPDPGKKADAVKGFFETTAERVAEWVRDGRVVLINCQAGRNRSVALCALVLSDLLGDEFLETLRSIERKAARAKPDENVPRSFLTTSGGEYFREAFTCSKEPEGQGPAMATRRSRSRRDHTEPSAKRQKGSYDERKPFKLRLYCGKGSQQGQLWLGNLEHARQAAASDTCDILNLSTKRLDTDTLTVKMSGIANCFQELELGS